MAQPSHFPRKVSNLQAGREVTTLTPFTEVPVGVDGYERLMEGDMAGVPQQTLSKLTVSVINFVEFVPNMIISGLRRAWRTKQ